MKAESVGSAGTEGVSEEEWQDDPEKDEKIKTSHTVKKTAKSLDHIEYTAFVEKDVEINK